MRFESIVGLASWFVGGVLLGLIELIALPPDPLYSTLLQLLPLLLLVGGIWLVIAEYQKLSEIRDLKAAYLRRLMEAGWFAVLGVNAGIASLNNMVTEIFHRQFPYYYQGVSIGQKATGIAGIFVLGVVSILAMLMHRKFSERLVAHPSLGFWEKPLTNIGFIAVLIGVVAGLAQYWLMIVFAGLILLIAGASLYLVGRLTESSVPLPDEETDTSA